MSGIAWPTVLYNIRFWTKFRMTKLASHVRIVFFRTQKNTPDTIRTSRDVYWPCVACPHLASHVRIVFLGHKKIPLTRFERATPSLGRKRSIQLSYRGILFIFYFIISTLSWLYCRQAAEVSLALTLWATEAFWLIISITNKSLFFFWIF